MPYIPPFERAPGDDQPGPRDLRAAELAAPAIGAILVAISLTCLLAFAAQAFG